MPKGQRPAYSSDHPLGRLWPQDPEISKVTELQSLDLAGRPPKVALLRQLESTLNDYEINRSGSGPRSAVLWFVGGLFNSLLCLLPARGPTSVIWDDSHEDKHSEVPRAVLYEETSQERTRACFKILTSFFWTPLSFPVLILCFPPKKLLVYNLISQAD